MREDKKIIPSPNNNNWRKKPWFWPSIYAAVAVGLIALIFTYSALTGNEEEQQDVADTTTSTTPSNEHTAIETNTRQETLKYPFNEELLTSVEVLQDFYDMTADEATRENALLVFNQTFSTSSGVSLSVSHEPFEVLAAMSGEVTKVKLDEFTGNQVTITHPNGMETRYSSVTDILIQEGDTVTQGQAIGTATDNEWNPAAGVHVHFEVLENGEHVNPRSFLSF